MLQTTRYTFPFQATNLAMYDVLYVLGTIVFFALMLGYVRACERLGRDDATDNAETKP